MKENVLQGEIRLNETAAENRKIGYVRIGHRVQNSPLAMYYEALNKLGVSSVYLDTEPAQPMLEKLLAEVKKGDTVCVESLNRLSRRTEKIVDVMDRLEQKGGTFISLRDSIDTGRSSTL